MEAVRRSIHKFEDKRYAVMKQRNIIGQVCHTPKSYDNVMHVGLRKVTFKWQRGNKIGTTESLCDEAGELVDRWTVVLRVCPSQVRASTERCTPASMSTLEN